MGPVGALLSPAARPPAAASCSPPWHPRPRPPPPAPRPARDKLPGLLQQGGYDWVAITSPEAAAVFLEGWGKAGRPQVRGVGRGRGTITVVKHGEGCDGAPALRCWPAHAPPLTPAPKVRVAVVGGGTREALVAAGIEPAFTASKVRHSNDGSGVGGRGSCSRPMRLRLAGCRPAAAAHPSRRATSSAHPPTPTRPPLPQAYGKIMGAELPHLPGGTDVVLYPASARASGDLQQSLEASGFSVNCIRTYDTVGVRSADPGLLAQALAADVVTFGSPSAVK
jgi:uroporphyrinogen-III synthase